MNVTNNQVLLLVVACLVGYFFQGMMKEVRTVEGQDNSCQVDNSGATRNNPTFVAKYFFKNWNDTKIESRQSVLTYIGDNIQSAMLQDTGDNNIAGIQAVFNAMVDAGDPVMNVIIDEVNRLVCENASDCNATRPCHEYNE